MRPVHPNLLARLRRGDSSIRYPVEAHAITQAVYKQTTADWQAGDGPPTSADFEFVVDGGLRIAPAISALVSSTTGSSNFTDLNNAFPYTVAHISWGGTDDPNVEIMRVTASLHPNRDGSGRTVVWWRCQLFAVSRAVYHAAVPNLQLTPLATAIDVQAAGDAAGNVTFDFSALAVRPKPKSVPVTADYLQFSINNPEYLHPCTIVMITALKADGSPATNVGWGYDNTISTFGTGNVLRSKTLNNTLPFPSGGELPAPAGIYVDRGSAGGVPKITLDTGAFTAETITFSSGNLLTLPAAPTGEVHLAAMADTPIGTSVTFRIRNDADSAYVDYTDGQTFTDLGLTATTTRKLQIVLTPNAAGNLTPTVRKAGMEEKTVVDLSHVAEVTSYKAHVDPVTLVAQPTQATIRAIKNGVANFRSTIEDLLTTYDIGVLEFRWYCGDTRLPRSQWTLIDAFPVVDDFEPGDAAVGITLLGANALISSALPKYDTAGAGVVAPDSVVTNPDLWTDQAGGSTNIHLTIDEDPPDDTDYVRTAVSPTNDTIEFGLANIADPARDTGHFVDFRMKKDATGGEVITMVVELRQGAVQVMIGEAITVPDEWTDYSLALSAAQAQSISNYSDLRIRFIANVVSGAGARRALVSWAQFRITGQRAALVYTNQAASTVYADLLNQAEVPARYIGQGLTSTSTVSKTITDGNALDEARALAAVFGYAVGSSRGAIWAVDMFSEQGIAASVPADRVEPVRITPGFRERRPRVSVLWNWSEAANRFDDEVVWQSTPALTKLGPGRIDAEERWNAESGKWIYTATLAQNVARRTGQALGTGLILWRFGTVDQWPEWEIGDVVAIGTSRFLAKDPHSTRALRGSLSALATITDCSYTGGFWEYTGWVQSYADVLGGPVGSHLERELPDIEIGSIVASGSVTASERVLAGAGTAAAPGVSFTDFSDVGLYAFVGVNLSDVLGLSADGQSALLLDMGTGGAISPLKKLKMGGVFGVVVANAALATNATAGFLYLPTCAGTPTGVPGAETGTTAAVYDTTNNRLYVYNGGWKSVLLA